MLSGLNNSSISYTKIHDSPPQLVHHFSEAPSKQLDNYTYSKRGQSLSRNDHERQLKDLLDFKDPDVWEPPPPI